MSTADPEHKLTVGICYADQHLIELETIFEVDGWSARATAYSQKGTLGEFARDLAQFSRALAESVHFDAGREDIGGYLGMRFYKVDSLGHLACHLKLATSTWDSPPPRPEEVWRVSIELHTWPGALDTFAASLARMATLGEGSATLALKQAR